MFTRKVHLHALLLSFLTTIAFAQEAAPVTADKNIDANTQQATDTTQEAAEAPGAPEKKEIIFINAPTAENVEKQEKNTSVTAQQPSKRAAAEPVKTKQQAKAEQKRIAKEEKQKRIQEIQNRREQYRQKITYGANAFIGSAELLTGSQNDDLDNGLGWSAGARLTLPLSDFIWFFQTGFQFISRTTSHSDSYTAEKNKIKMYNLALPLLIGANAGYTRISFNLGIQLEFPIYNKLTSYYKGEKIYTLDNIDKDNMEYVDWDFILGASVKAAKHFSIDLRLTAGISEIYSDLYYKNEYWDYSTIDYQIGFSLYI
ncbi:MAG: outer membrane beta-barrel protein [Fibrobacter sp.]|nr:outer membrane beta-barrel protein [Fibrobacter sp.]